MFLIKNSLLPIAAGRVSTRALFQVLKGGRNGLKMEGLQAPFLKHVLQRSCSTETNNEKYGAVVLGAGPAGLAVVGNLLEQKKGPVLWVSYGSIGQFGGGRLHKLYRVVPSNTKAKFFTMFANALEPFRQVTGETDAPNAYTRLKELDQERTCPISGAADLAVMLGRGLGFERGVLKFRGDVQSASWSNDNHWNVKICNGGTPGLPPLSASSRLLFLCPGSHPTSAGIPNSPTEGQTSLSLDICLDPTKLSRYLQASISNRSDPAEKTTVAVIGASHSAILVLRNLYNLITMRQGFHNLRIKWLTRHELRYAEERDGWIKRDNTGLKGEVAQWAKENLEADTFPTSDVSKYLEKVKTSPETEQEDQDRHLQGCHHVVHAIGFSRNTLPVIKRDGKELEITYDHETSGFVDAEGNTIRGLYGAGIAFPEKVVDPEGTTEYAVGLWKFMKYLKRVAPTWTA